MAKKDIIWKLENDGEYHLGNFNLQAILVNGNLLIQTDTVIDPYKINVNKDMTKYIGRNILRDKDGFEVMVSQGKILFRGQDLRDIIVPVATSNLKLDKRKKFKNTDYTALGIVPYRNFKYVQINTPTCVHFLKIRPGMRNLGYAKVLDGPPKIYYRGVKISTVEITKIIKSVDGVNVTIPKKYLPLARSTIFYDTTFKNFIPISRDGKILQDRIIIQRTEFDLESVQIVVRNDQFEYISSADVNFPIDLDLPNTPMLTPILVFNEDGSGFVMMEKNYKGFYRLDRV